MDIKTSAYKYPLICRQFVFRNLLLKEWPHIARTNVSQFILTRIGCSRHCCLIQQKCKIKKLHFELIDKLIHLLSSVASETFRLNSATGAQTVSPFWLFDCFVYLVNRGNVTQGSIHVMSSSIQIVQNSRVQAWCVIG